MFSFLGTQGINLILFTGKTTVKREDGKAYLKLTVVDGLTEEDQTC